VKMLPPSLSPERAKVAEFYSAGSGTIPPLPWQIFPPPFSPVGLGRRDIVPERLGQLLLLSRRQGCPGRTYGKPGHGKSPANRNHEARGAAPRRDRRALHCGICAFSPSTAGQTPSCLSAHVLT
jgi:hypothetical protein